MSIGKFEKVKKFDIAKICTASADGVTVRKENHIITMMWSI